MTKGPGRRPGPFVCSNERVQMEYSPENDSKTQRHTATIAKTAPMMKSHHPMARPANMMAPEPASHSGVHELTGRVVLGTQRQLLARHPEVEAAEREEQGREDQRGDADRLLPLGPEAVHQGDGDEEDEQVQEELGLDAHRGQSSRFSVVAVALSEQATSAEPMTWTRVPW